VIIFYFKYKLKDHEKKITEISRLLPL